MVCNAKIGKAFFHLSKEIRGLRRQIFSEARSVRDDDPLSFILGVENAQGIAVQAAAAVFREPVAMLFEIGNEGGPVSFSAFGVAERVQLQFRPAEHAESVQDLRAQSDDLDISRRISHPEQFYPDLVK